MRVSIIVPDILTSFSILFARYKEDLEELIRGAYTVKILEPQGQSFDSEGCATNRTRIWEGRIPKIGLGN